MKERRTTVRFCFLLAVFFVLLLTGCSQKEQENVQQEVVFTFAGEDVTLGETYIYAKTVQEDYTSTYGEDVWTMEVSLEDGTVLNLEEATREDIIQNIVRVKVLCRKADELGITLTDEERSKVLLEADNFWKNLTDEQIQTMQLNEEMLQNVLLENKLAEKTYEEIIAGGEIEVSDEEARETTFYDMYFECYSEDEAGNIVPYSEEQKEAQYEKALQAYSTLIDPIDTEEKGNIENLSEYYGLKYSTYYTMTPAEIESVYGPEICEDLYKLEDGSYSLVTETEYGYHIFYMTALTDREKTDANKAEITAKREKAYFDSRYQNWVKEADKKFSYEKSVDQDVYGKIPF